MTNCEPLQLIFAGSPSGGGGGGVKKHCRIEDIVYKQVGSPEYRKVMEGKDLSCNPQPTAPRNAGAVVVI